MTSSPIPRVLGTFRRHRVRALLMGGQACILYGGAEFSRDIDFAIAVDAGNLDRLRAALAELDAHPIFFPELSAEALKRGHAAHFRCQAPGLHDLRIDLMHVMRGAADFAQLWKRRRRVHLPEAGGISIMALEDLVAVKKTQRDKDWPMVRRLIESDIVRARRPSAAKVGFWLRECRTADILIDLAARHRALARRFSHQRPVLVAALTGDLTTVARELREEEDRERLEDRQYWLPLRAELEVWRRTRPRKSGPDLT